MTRLFRRLGHFVKLRAWWIAAALLIVSFGAIPGILSLRTDSGLNSLVSSGSELKANTSEYEQLFGGEPITVLLEGSVASLFLQDNLARLGALEADLYRIPGVRSVQTPRTILLQAIGRISLEIKSAQASAGQSSASDQLNTLAQLLMSGAPSLDNPALVKSLVFQPDGSINSSFSALVPDLGHALLIITPRGDLGDAAAASTAAAVENAVTAHPLQDLSPTVVSSTQIIVGIASSLKSNLALLLGLALAVMLLILFLFFRVRWRLLSLLLVGVGVLWTFGLMGYISIPLSMATMAVLPILVGLGIDYPIQLHNRYEEEFERTGSAAKAVTASLSRLAPAVGVALLATVIGFVTLYVSDVPMIRDFGTLLAVGTVICFLTALLGVSSILYLKDRRKTGVRTLEQSARSSGWLEKALRRVTSLTLSQPIPIAALALALGIAGGALDHWIPVNTDYEALIPQDLPALENMRDLRSTLGVSGQVHFLIRAEDLSDPDTLVRLKDFQDAESSQHPALVSPSGLVSLITQANNGQIPQQAAAVRAVLGAIPEQISSEAISGNRTLASLSWGIKPLPLSDLHNLIQGIEQDAKALDGVKISAAGAIALGANMVDSVVRARIWMDGLCLAAIFSALWIIYRRLRRVLLIIVPVGLVIGWASLLMSLLQIPLNPLTAILGVLTSAIGTEFTVLLISRYEEEKALGADPRAAMQTAAVRMGRAIVTTGVTTLGGFGVLIASNFVMVRDFGLITLLGILLCLIAAMVVVPPIAVWIDERRAGRLPQARGN